MNTNSSHLLPNPLLYALMFLTAAVSFKIFNQLDADYDLWLHLLMGKQAILNGLIETIDRYSFTASGHPVINHEWAAQIMMTVCHMAGGHTGLILWRWVMTLIMVFLILRLIIIQTPDNFNRTVLFLCAAIVLSRGISFRVQLFSYLFLLILINLIYCRIRWDRILPLYFISFFFMLWANIHGAFVLGLLVWYIHIYFNIFVSQPGNRKPVLVLTLFIMPLLATLVTPFGFRLWAYIAFELTSPMKMYISEWQPFAFSSRELPFFIILTATWTGIYFSRKRKEWVEIILVALCTVMGFMSVRHTPLFAILGLPALARHGGSSISRLLAQGSKGKHASPIQVYAASFILVFAAIFYIRLGIPNSWHIQTDKDPLPRAAVLYLKENAFHGNLWTPLHWGGYLLYHLYPDVRVSIDGRWATVYPEKVMRDNINFSYEGSSGRWKQILDEYKATAAACELDNPIIQEAQHDPDWISIQYDDSFLLLKAIP